VIIAVRAMRMMKVAIHEVIDVVTVRNGRMSAAWPVDMIGRMGAASVTRRAGVGIGRADAESMLLDGPIRQRMVQVSVMEIVDMPFVIDRRVTAIRPVFVRMIGVDVRCHA